MAGGGIGEMMLINAAIGGTVSAVSGGDPLKGMLLGGLTGGLMGGAAGGTVAGTGLSAAPSAATTAAGATNYALAAPSAAGAGGVGLAAPAASSALTTPGLSAAVDYSLGAATSPLASLGGVGLAPPSAALASTAAPTASTALTGSGADQGILSGMMDKFKALPFEKQLLYGGMGGMGLMSLAQQQGMPEPEEYKGPLSKYRFDPEKYRRSRYAGGGIAGLAPVAMADGGMSDLGTYSDGGRMLQGPGDGMSDNIPGVIGGTRPARLADGEFVVPADVVSHLGNGSTNAGAKQLYAMMDRVRQARTGNEKQGREIKPASMMPA